MKLQVPPENTHYDDGCFLIFLKECHGDACFSNWLSDYQTKTG
jgi:hypothetical protein